MNIKNSIYLILLTSALHVNAQNYDLAAFKDFDQLSKVNPAFTGALQKLRLLANNRGADLNIGLETRIFKSDHYLGVGFNQVSIESVRRQTLYASYNKDFTLKNKALFKVAIQGDYHQKNIFTREGDTMVDFVDFDGKAFRYIPRSMAPPTFGRNYFDLGIGFGYMGKRLVIGGNVKHVNRAQSSISKKDDSRLPLEANAQICGFFNLGKWMLIPTGVLSVQGDQMYYNVGGGINYLEYTLTGKLENANERDWLDIGLNYRKGRIFASVGYAFDLAQSDGIDFSQINISLNTSLRKIKNPESEVIRHLSNLY
jgi:hypothetical protein